MPRLRLVLATRNPHKTRELSALLSDCPVEIVGLDAFPALPETVEDRPTIEGNARKKALEAAEGSGAWALADDTGLEVEALGGAPGVYSARYAGPGRSYADNNDKLLAALSGVPEERRGARFRTVMALASPEGSLTLEEGVLRGRIAETPRGAHGFGYDPVFVVEGDTRTLAEYSADEKNKVSHRARALQKIIPHIRKLAAAVLCVLCVLCGASRSSSAAKTEPGQETIWDEIMASQANRDLRLGSVALENKDYDAAVKQFLRALAANPRDPAAHMMLGAAYYWTGQVDKSIDEYQRSLQLDGGSAQAHMLLGISLAWKGQTRGAYDEFKRAAALDPARPDIQMNMGSVEDSLGLTDDALFHFRRAVQLAPREPLYHFQLGMLYRKLGRDQDAADELRQSLKLFGDFEDALLELGAVDERSGDLRAAINDFRKAVQLKSRDGVARFRLGRLYLLNGQPKLARQIFADAFHLTPEEGGQGLQLSIAYAGGKKLGPADAPGAKPASSAPAKPRAKPQPPASNDPLDVFARSLERIPLDQDALMQVDVIFMPQPRLIKASPESRSSLKRALERAAEADRVAPKAVRRDYSIRSGTQEQRDADISKVLDDLRRTMKGAPPGSDVRLGMNLTFTHLADARAAGAGGSGQGSGAGPGGGDAQSHAKVSYQPREVGNDLGLWIIGTGWMSLVEEVLPDPGEKPPHPEMSDWWVADGLGFATLGDGQRAMDSFARACALDPRNEAALLGRGVASVMTGDEAGAIASFEQVLKLDPKNKPAADGLKWLRRPTTGTAKRD